MSVTQNTPASPAASEGDLIQRIAVGPDGFGMGVDLKSVEDGKAVGFVDDREVQRALSQVLGNGVGIEKTAQAIMEQDDKIHRKNASNPNAAPVVRGRGGLKLATAAQAPAPRATDAFSAATFGKTPEQQAENKHRIDELLAFRHKPVLVDIAHLNPPTPQAQAALDHATKPHESAMHRESETTSPKTATKTVAQAQQRPWAGLISAPGMIGA